MVFFKLMIFGLLMNVACSASDIVKRQINACFYLSCQNGGTCVYFRNIATCQCPLGFIGSRCELQGNSVVLNSALCSSQFCLNGGRCIQITSSQAVCFCINGFTGLNCERSASSPSTPSNVNLCASITCLNNGQCIQLSLTLGIHN